MDLYFVNPHHPHSSVTMPPSPPDEIALSDYLMLDDYVDHQDSPSSHSTESSEKDAIQGFSSSTGATSKNNINIKCKSRNKGGVGTRIAFRTKSELEIMDDGYKWRKYGKKSVKSSPNLRNYYKCSNGGCGVKKRVERDRDDSSYVITTYEGVHNHESPFTTSYSPVSFVHTL